MTLANGALNDGCLSMNIQYLYTRRNAQKIEEGLRRRGVSGATPSWFTRVFSFHFGRENRFQNYPNFDLLSAAARLKCTYTFGGVEMRRNVEIYKLR